MAGVDTLAVTLLGTAIIALACDLLLIWHA
jgi:hypothetical protein